MFKSIDKDIMANNGVDVFYLLVLFIFAHGTTLNLILLKFT